MISRRDFIRSSLLAGAGLASGAALASLNGCSPSCRCVQPVKKHKYVLADIHNHPVVNDWIRRSPLAVRSPSTAAMIQGFIDQTSTSLKKCHAVKVDLICASHFNLFDEWISMPTDPNPNAPVNTIRMIDLLEEELEGPSAEYAKIIRTPEEFKSHFNNYDKDDPDFRIAVLHSLEGGHSLGGSLNPLEIFSRRGVITITIGHFFNKGIASAPNAYPFFPDANSLRPNQGLSPFGEEVICEMERLGIIVDITHSTSTSLDDVLRVSTKPLIATHSSIKTLGDHAYSLHEEHVQEIIHRGGMIGILFHPYWLSNYSNIFEAEEHGSLREVVRTLRYAAKISGSFKHICIGSDFGGYIPRLKDINCLCQIDILRNLLLDEFGDENIVDDIMARNAIDFIGSNWKRNV